MSHVLIIEPSKPLAATYRRALELVGHQTSWAAHAQDAVYESDKQRPDVVVLELQLTRHNGIEFLYEFRSYPEWQDVPVVLLTLVPPASLQITSQIMERLGIVQCLYKPATNLVQLRRAVTAAAQPQFA